MEDKQKMEENKQKIIDAKIRYLLNLGPEVDISKLTKRVTVEDQMEEVARLEKEIEILRQPQQDVEMEKEATLSLKNLEMETEAVMKEITAMRKEHYEKIKFGKDCQVLTFMVDQVSLRLQEMKMQKKFLEEQLEKMKRDEELLQNDLDEKKRKEVEESWKALHMGNQRSGFQQPSSMAEMQGGSSVLKGNMAANFLPSTSRL